MFVSYRNEKRSEVKREKIYKVKKGAVFNRIKMENDSSLFIIIFII